MKSKKMMLLAMTLCMGAATSAWSQNEPGSQGAQANMAARAEGNGSGAGQAQGVTAITAVAAQPVKPQSDITQEVTGKKNKKEKVKAEEMSPDDPRKSPYWEPKDWEYIYNNTP